MLTPKKNRPSECLELGLTLANAQRNHEAEKRTGKAYTVRLDMSLERRNGEESPRKFIKFLARTVVIMCRKSPFTGSQ